MTARDHTPIQADPALDPVGTVDQLATMVGWASESKVIVTTVAPAVFNYTCRYPHKGGECPVEIAVDYPGYTLAYEDGSSQDRIQALREEQWEAMVEVWHHGEECRTFTQEDFRQGKVEEWLKSLHSPEGTP